MDQNSALKKEAGIAERKLLARNERIQNLEALLQDADRRLAVQNQKFEAQLQAVKDRLDQARGNFTSQVAFLIAQIISSFSSKGCGCIVFELRADREAPAGRRGCCAERWPGAHHWRRRFICQPSCEAARRRVKVSACCCDTGKILFLTNSALSCRFGQLWYVPCADF